MQVVLDHVKDESPQIRSFFFRPNRQLDYQAGQFVDLILPSVGKHWFTLSSAPADELLRVTTKLGQPASDYKRALWQLQPGDSVNLSEAMGDFVLPLDATRPLTFVASGLGITPFHSIIRQLKLKGQHRPIRFIYTARHEADLVLLDDLDLSDIDLTTMLTQPTANWTGRTGRISAATILELDQTDPNGLFYLAGPELMVERLRSELISQKIAAEQIVGDYFPGYEQI